MGESYYDILDLTKEATPEEIRVSYFEHARKYHPDTNPSSLAREMFFRIQEAYEVLSNPEKRIKYDKTITEKERSKSDVKVSLEYSKREIQRLPDSQLIYVKMELEIPENIKKVKTPEIHLCLVVDHSTSMKGERIEMVKENIVRLVQKLNGSDILSIVLFNDKADLLLTPTKVADLKKIENRLEQFQCSGATEIYKGLKAGADLLWGNSSSNCSKHLILLTDGHTYGDEEQCYELMKKLAEKSIVVSTLGLGNEWNDVFLDRLAGLTGGSSAFISSGEDLQNYMQNFADSIGSVVARGLTLDIDSDKGIKKGFIFRIQPEIMELPAETPISLGDLHQKHKSIYLMSFIVPPLAKEVTKVTLGKGRIYLEIYSSKMEKIKIPVEISLPVKEEITSEEAPIDIVNALSKITLYKMQEMAKQDVVNGDIKKAIKRLGCISTQLLEQGNEKLARVALEEAEMLKNNQKSSIDGNKQLKYGTRALLLLPENEKRDL